MSIFCCRRNRQPSVEETEETQTGVTELPTQPPRARLSQAPSSDTDMYLSTTLTPRGPSQLGLPTYHNIADPEAVEVEDSDDDGAEIDVRMPHTSTLGSFKTKLIRRLSHRVDSKTGSRPSIGTSDEELARRAELKRLMHKRIQEELKSEAEEEDLGLAPLGHPSLGICGDPELPGGGPRDTIEFSVSAIGDKEAEKEAKRGVDKLPEALLPPAPVVDGSRGVCQRRTSCSEPPTRSTGSSYHDCNRSFNDIRSIIQPPSPLHSSSVHLQGESSHESPSASSWRLSHSTIHIESYIEPLVEARQVSYLQSPELGNSSSEHDGDPYEVDASIDYSNPTMRDDVNGTSKTTQVEHTSISNGNDNSNRSLGTSDGRCSPLDVWLWSQNLRCVSMLADRRSSETAPELREPSIREQVEGLQIPQNSADLLMRNDTSADSSSSFQGKISGACRKSPKRIAPEGNPPITAPSNESVALRRILSQIENAFPAEEQVANGQSGNVSSRYTSSHYATRPDGSKTTLRGSRLSLMELIGGRRFLQPSAPIYGPVYSHQVTTTNNSDINLCRTAPKKEPSLNHLQRQFKASPSLMAETLSINASETTSFRQREEELKSIEKRFGLPSTHRYPMGPVLSRFREEFEDSKGPNNRKSSILSKLHLVLPRRGGYPSLYLEPNKGDKGIGIGLAGFPGPNESLPSDFDLNRGQRLPPNFNGHTGERTLGLQQDAPKKEADRCPKFLQTGLVKASMPKADVKDIGAEIIPINSCGPITSKTRSIDRARIFAMGLYPPSRTPNTMLNEIEDSNTLDIHAGVLQEWVEQLQAEDVQRQSRTESRIDPPGQPPKLRTPPESWAKWPSHTRKGRTALAGEKDKVKSWDFAVAVNSNPFGVGPKDKGLSKGMELTAASRTLSSQIGKVLKYGWNKMITHRGSLGRSSDHHESAVLDTHRPHGFLEYPELELLPTVEGFREVQALDQQIDTMKRRSTSSRRLVRQSSSDGGTRPPLANRIVKEVHKFWVEGDDIAWADVEYHTKAPPRKPLLSLAHILPTRRSKSCNPELLGAPESQCRYEDCVQTQMLNGDDDNDDTARYQDSVILKRARSTGNIEAKLPGNIDGHSPRDPKAQITRLRRHRSLSWVHGRGCD